MYVLWIRISKIHVCNYLYRKEHVFKTHQSSTIAHAPHKTLASWIVSLPYSCACSHFYWRFNRVSPMRCKQQKVVEKVGWSRDVAAKVQRYPVKHTKRHNLPQLLCSAIIQGSCGFCKCLLSWLQLTCNLPNNAIYIYICEYIYIIYIYIWCNQETCWHHPMCFLGLPSSPTH